MLKVFAALIVLASLNASAATFPTGKFRCQNSTSDSEATANIDIGVATLTLTSGSTKELPYIEIQLEEKTEDGRFASYSISTVGAVTLGRDSYGSSSFISMPWTINHGALLFFKGGEPTYLSILGGGSCKRR